MNVFYNTGYNKHIFSFDLTGIKSELFSMYIACAVYEGYASFNSRTSFDLVTMDKKNVEGYKFEIWIENSL